METTLYLIRHAQSRPSAGKPDPEWPLSDRGKDQAEKLASCLLSLGIEHVYSSPYPRCLGTIEPFAKDAGLPVTVDRDLRERRVAPGLIDDFQAVWERSWEDLGFALPDCETSHDAQDRFVAAVLRICEAHPGRTIGISSHGNVIALFLNHLDSANGRVVAEGIRNPDVLRFVLRQENIVWDRSFELTGLVDFATGYDETPIER